MRIRQEEGQATILVVLAMSIFLLGAVGLAIDGSNLFWQRTMAQTAADAAAQSAMMSIFDGTNTFTDTVGSSFTCSTSDTKTPCVYAARNGFGGTSSDTVKVYFPKASEDPAGVSLSSTDAVNLVQVTVTRTVKTTLMKLLGPSASKVEAIGEAAIVSVVAPVPILVIHPTLTGSLGLSGNASITICGGPSRSIQVNSSDLSAFGMAGTVDLSLAGPPDTGNCKTGTGASIGVWGGPATETVNTTAGPASGKGLWVGSTGSYIQPASPIKDPLLGVSAPTAPAAAASTFGVAAGTYGCPAGTSGGCTLYFPGSYPTGFDGKLKNVVFAPGLYYMTTGGFNCTANCNLYMATGLTDSGSGVNTASLTTTCCGTSTTWTGNMMVFNTGTGQFNLGANGNISLVGSPSSSTYQGILFFEDRTAASNTSANKPKNPHSLGGGGNMTLLGTIYLTNTAVTEAATSSHYQELDLSGNSGSSTLIEGEIIVDSLQIGGTGGITMDLNSNAIYTIRQVALVY